MFHRLGINADTWLWPQLLDLIIQGKASSTLSRQPSASQGCLLLPGSRCRLGVAPAVTCPEPRRPSQSNTTGKVNRNKPKVDGETPSQRLTTAALGARQQHTLT